MAASESDRLLAAGSTIEVAGGETALRFSLLALKRCEDEYGTLQGLLGEIAWLTQQAVSGWPEPVAERLGVLLAAITGDPSAVDAWSSPVLCVDAIVAAWEQAFPAPDEGKAVGATTPPSPGRTGGGSPSSTAG